MNHRFRPPPLAGFYVGPDTDHAFELTETRREAFAEGHAIGLREGHVTGVAEGAALTRSGLEPELEALCAIRAKRHAVGAVAKALRKVLAARDADLALLEREVRELTAAALETLFPTVLAHASGAEIATLLGEALADRAPEALTLRAHPDTLAAVATEFAAMRDDGERGHDRPVTGNRGYRRNDPDRSDDQSAVDQSGVDRSGVDRSGVDQSGVDQSGVDQSGVDRSHNRERAHAGLPTLPRLKLLPRPGMPPGAAEIAWSGGGLTFDPAALLARIASVLGGPTSSTQSQPLKASS